MPTEDSGMMPLGCLPRLCEPAKPWRRRVETVVVMACLVGGGFGLGYAYASRVADVKAGHARDDHQHEITRLQQAWSASLRGLAGRVGEAANTSAAAAQAAGEAASTAQAAAATAARAAKDAKK